MKCNKTVQFYSFINFVIINERIVTVMLFILLFLILKIRRKFVIISVLRCNNIYI